MSFQILFRVLGKCLKCNAEDTIVSGDGTFGNVRCEQCDATWNDYLTELVYPGRKEGERFIPVLVETMEHSASLNMPRASDVPFARLIVSALNAALIARFKLRVCLTTEGGVEGQWNGRHIELRNADRQVGLYDDHGYECASPVCQEILGWYGELLKILFLKELTMENRNYGRGAILKLANTPDDEGRAKILLFLAFWKKTGSKGFATHVFKTLERERAKLFGGLFIAGLSNEDIARIFVPPPIQI